MLGRQDLGHRVVIRRIVGSRNARPVFSDVLGELVDLTETHLTVNSANGPLRLPLAEVHRAKRVPPRRRQPSDIIALELVANEAWPAPVQERLGDWLLRAADGWTGRANSALAVGDPQRPLDDAIDAVQRWYAARGQHPLITVPLPLAAPVARALDARGWDARPPVLVQTAPLAALLDAVPTRPDLPPVTLAHEPSPAWLDIVAARKGSLPDAARHVLTGVDQVRFGEVRAEGGGLLAIARGTVTGGGRWLGLTLVEVVPEARRRGLAQHLIRALADWAVSLGATDAFLQVEETNEPARALYRRLGFTTHHRFVTRVAPRAGS